MNLTLKVYARAQAQHLSNIKRKIVYFQKVTNITHKLFLSICAGLGKNLAPKSLEIFRFGLKIAQSFTMGSNTIYILPQKNFLDIIKQDSVPKLLVLAYATII